MKKNNDIKRPLPHNYYFEFQREIRANTVRRLNPDKTDEELGLNKPTFNDVVDSSSSDLFYSIKNLFFKFINW